jgi:hypothetical protein
MAEQAVTVDQVLACPMGENDANAKTIRDYLGTLLLTLWIEGQGFSGKRPFGNSDWEHEVYTALAEAGYIEGSKDDEDWGWEYDEATGNALIQDAIRHLGGFSKAT